MASARQPQSARKRNIAQSNAPLAAALQADPPQSIQAEVSVLGALLLNNETIDVAGPLLAPDAFFSIAHQKIYAAVLGLHERQRAVDFVTLHEELEGRGQLEAVGGMEYISSLLDYVPAAANVEHYIEIVREKAVIRNLLGAAREIFDAAAQPGCVSRKLLDEAQSKIFHIAEQGTRNAAVAIEELLKDTFAKIDKNDGRDGMLTGLGTGFYDLDELTSGLQPGELIILAARPSMGKTTLALNLVQHVGVQLGMPAVVFSLEMSGEQVARNMLCSYARIDSHRLRRGQVNPADMGRLAKDAGGLTVAPIYIDDTPGLNPFELRSKVRRLKANKNVSLVVVDYLQLMEGPGAESRQVEISTISRNLKSLAREMRVPVIALSQLNRQVESRDDKRPRMADLRESGSIEQDADVVMLLHRPAYYAHDEEGKADTSAELIIAKQRNGPTGLVKLSFISQYMRFESSTEGMREF